MEAVRFKVGLARLRFFIAILEIFSTWKKKAQHRRATLKRNYFRE
jgi:hypothetical protein